MASSLLGLAPGGGYLVHLHYCKCRWSLTPPFHHHPAQARGCLFLWPFSGRFAPCGGSPPRGLSDAVLYGVRTFLDPDNAGPRSPNRPEATLSYTQEYRASTSLADFKQKLNRHELPAFRSTIPSPRLLRLLVRTVSPSPAGRGQGEGFSPRNKSLLYSI